MSESPFNKVTALKVSCFIKKRLQQKCFPVIAKFLGTPILKNSCKQLLLHILSLNYRCDKWKINKSNYLISGMFRSSPSEVLKKILLTSPKYFFKFQESHKVHHRLNGS